MNSSNSTAKNLLLGKNEQHLSYTGYKLAVLTGQLSVVTLFLNLGYIAFDLTNGIYDSWPYLIISATLAFVSFFLNRSGYYFIAKLILGLSVNMSVFVFALMEPIETGISFLFVISAMGALSTLGFEQKKWALALLLVPILLFIFSVVSNLEMFPRKPFDAHYVQTNIILNFVVAFIAASLVIYFLLSLNYYSENALQQNERRLYEKNQELIKVNKELDRFVYITSHDLRSPISSVRGLINILKISKNPGAMKMQIDMMDKQLLSLNKFIDDIVIYSRNSRLVVKVESIHVKQLIDEILLSLQFHPYADKVNVHVNISEDIIIKSDPTRVRIVLANIISNAYKYSNHDPDSSFIKISAKQSNNLIEISVVDNGPGIEPQFITRIFEMFFQANEKAEGSGLGLYIVKETLEKIHGKIHVQSETGKGSEFIITLPREISEVKKA